MGGVYKLCMEARAPVLKVAPNKSTLPGDFELFRAYDAEGFMCGDVIACRGEKPGIVYGIIPNAVRVEDLLYDFMQEGRIISGFDSLGSIQEYGIQQWKALPDPYKSLSGSLSYPVLVSPALAGLQQGIQERIGGTNGV
jgi:hypothetical protein